MAERFRRARESQGLPEQQKRQQEQEQEQEAQQASKQAPLKGWTGLERTKQTKWVWAIRYRGVNFHPAREPFHGDGENTFETMHTMKPFSSMLYISIVLSS